MSLSNRGPTFRKRLGWDVSEVNVSASSIISRPWILSTIVATMDSRLDSHAYQKDALYLDLELRSAVYRQCFLNRLEFCTSHCLCGRSARLVIPALPKDESRLCFSAQMVEQLFIHHGRPAQQTLPRFAFFSIYRAPGSGTMICSMPATNSPQR